MATGAVSLSEINSIINRVIANSIVNFGRETIVIAPRYDDLPRAIQKEAERQGYDDLNPDDRITDVNYKFKIYVIHENIQSKDEVEETILHERIFGICLKVLR
jgi:hypothetical protein